MDISDCSLCRLRREQGLYFLEPGMKVEQRGKTGVIVSGYEDQLVIRFDGCADTTIVHPMQNIKYFDGNNIPFIEYK